MKYTHQGALISPCQRYRYRLFRRWAYGDTVAWIGLNPSTADANEDDNTIRRVVDFSARFGFGACLMLNLFSYRSTDPKLMYANLAQAVGEHDDHHISVGAIESAMVIAAWGSYPQFSKRMEQVIKEVTNVGKTLYCLGQTKDGYPRHPLYLPKVAQLEFYRVVI